MSRTGLVSGPLFIYLYFFSGYVNSFIRFTEVGLKCKLHATTLLAITLRGSETTTSVCGTESDCEVAQYSLYDHYTVTTSTCYDVQKVCFHLAWPRPQISLDQPGRENRPWE